MSARLSRRRVGRRIALKRLQKIRALAESLDQDNGCEFASLMANIESACDQAAEQIEKADDHEYASIMSSWIDGDKEARL